jgi:diguanylate cyclase (GGDEF)-like protein
MLNDGHVSRQHCRIRISKDGVVVEDLHSANGTLVNGNLVERATLSGNDRLQVGNILFKVEYRDALELEREEQRYREATTDALTGVPNQRWIVDQGTSCLATIENSDQFFSLLVLSIDGYQSLRDRYGLIAADEAVKHVANVVQHAIRKQDLLGRYSGDEFVVVLPLATFAHAKVFCERLKRVIASSPLRWDNGNIPLTVSVGVHTASGLEVISFAALVDKAHDALHAAKQSGYNQVVSTSQMI